MALFLIATESLSAQAPAQARIQGPIDDTQLVRLRGNTHPLARAEYDQGAAPADLPAQHMVILLSRTPDRDAALEKFLGEQQDRSSPSYMKWLTPAEFGDKFGPAEADVSAVTAWLAQQGFTVERVSAGKMAIEFSGDAARVQRAFHTAIHQYVVNGRQYWANADDPEIPAALATVVRGVVSLNDFPRKPLSRTFGLFRRQADGTVTPEYTGQSSSGSYYAVGPGDFAAIYNTTPLLQAGNNGAGQTIALLGVSNVHLSDIASFRSIFNLGTGDTSVVIDGPDPGIVAGAEGESVLDLEWSSAVAPGAKVMLVSAQDTVTTSGLDLAALHVIDNNLAGVMSVSYGYCEAGLGTTENQYIQSLWQQAAAQGITVLVSAGDSGSAGCDYQSSTKIAQHGLAVNGLASTAYNVAVGGTDFNDVGSQSTYWNTTNDPTTRTSAKGYIPEMTWNSTCAATATLANPSVCPVMPSSGTPAAGSGLQILAASGGPSSCTVSTATSGSVQCQGGRAKPAWQSGTGVPADGVRDLPDVSLFAAVSSSSNSFYMVCQSDTQYGAVCQPGSSFSFFAVGGTSASAAAFAGIVALAEQKAGTRLGNLNPLLYSLAAQTGASCRTSSSGGSACMFNDVVSGNIAVPCTAGTPNCSASSGSTTGVEVDATGAPAYAAGTGYDLATGLGTVNVTNLVNGIASAVKNAAATSVALTLNGSQAAVTATHGDSIGVAVSVTPAASSGTVSLLGKSGGIDSGSLSSGAAAWNSRMFPGGSYTVTARYPGDATHAASDSNGISVTISPEASQTLLSLVTFDAQGQPIFGAASTPYGSPYVLHGEVADAAATVSAAGVSSTCSKQTASCPTGKVALTSNGSALDGGSFTLNSKGYFEDWQIQLPAGSYTISGSYPGDASYLSNTGTAAVTISKAPTTLTANKAPLGDVPYGSPTQVNAFVTTHSSGSAPTGVYNWFEDGAATTEVVQSGAVDARAGIGTTSASATYYGWYVPGTLGAHSLYAQYSGDADYMGADSSAAPFAVTVVKTGTWANSYGVLPNIALPTTQVTLTISVGSTSVLAEPTGTVTFSDNGNPVNGTVSYSGHAGSGTNYDASLQAQLKATFATGTHTITATYSGDDHYNGMTQTLGTLTVYDKLPTTITVTPEINPTAVNYSTQLTASVTGPSFTGAPALTGTITFFDNGQTLGTAPFNSLRYVNDATLPFTFTTTGAHSITASYSGDDAHASSTTASPLALTVADKLPTKPYLNPNSGVVNQQLTINGWVEGPAVYAGPMMSGTVTFLDGSTPLAGTVNYQYTQGHVSVTMPYTFTTAGVHNVTMQYNGDNYYAASQTQPAAWKILGPLGIILSFEQVTTGASGGSGSQSVEVINTTTSAMTVALTCQSDSTAATCSMNSPSITVAANTNRGAQMTYTVPALTAGVRRHSPFTMPFILAAVLAGLPMLTRKRRAAMLGLMAIVLVLALTSCGGGGSTGGNPSGNSGGTTTTTPSSKTYHFTVTATSGSNTDSQVLTVTVQ